MEFTVVLDRTYFLPMHRKNINITVTFFSGSLATNISFLTWQTLNEEESKRCLEKHELC